MKKRIYSVGVFFFIVLIIAVASCKKDVTLSSVGGQAYFPVKIGSYVVYDVDSINFYDVTLTSDTFHWQLKQVVDSVYIDGTNTPAYILYRYIRSTPAGQWILSRIWSAKVNSEQAEVDQENLRFIKLIFPIYPNITWHGNAYLPDNTSIYSKYWNYTYSNVDTTYLLNNTPLDSTVVVEQQDSVTQVSQDVEIESYTKNIGLTYKQSMHVGRQSFLTPLPWIPQSGTIVTYTFNSHG